MERVNHRWCNVSIQPSPAQPSPAQPSPAQGAMYFHCPALLPTPNTTNPPPPAHPPGPSPLLSWPMRSALSAPSRLCFLSRKVSTWPRSKLLALLSSTWREPRTWGGGGGGGGVHCGAGQGRWVSVAPEDWLVLLLPR
jgi:hypothetical protein